MLRLSVYFGFFLSFSFAIGQNRFEIKGKAFDLVSRKPVFQILIINKTTNQSTLTDSSGNFSIKAYFNDVICAQSIAYHYDSIAVIRQNVIARKPFIFLLRPKVFNLEEVVIAKKTFVPYYEQPWKTFNNEVQVYTPGKFNPAAFLSPITYFYQRNSKKYKTLRKVYAMNEVDRSNFRLKERINKSVMDFAGIEEADFDPFVNQLKLPKDFINTSSDYEFMVRLKKEFANYKTQEE